MPDTLSHSPADIMARMLADMGLVSDVEDGSSWPIFVASMPNSPDNLVTITDTTGRHDGRSMVGGVLYVHFGWQIMARSLLDNSAWTKLNMIHVQLAKVHRRFVPVGAITYRVQAVTPTTTILALGFDETSKRRLFSLNGYVSLEQLPGTGSYYLGD